MTRDESLETAPEPLPEWQRKILDERLAALEARPDEGSPPQKVEKRVWPEHIQ